MSSKATIERLNRLNLWIYHARIFGAFGMCVVAVALAAAFDIFVLYAGVLAASCTSGPLVFRWTVLRRAEASGAVRAETRSLVRPALGVTLAIALAVGAAYVWGARNAAAGSLLVFFAEFVLGRAIARRNPERPEKTIAERQIQNWSRRRSSISSRPRSD